MPLAPGVRLGPYELLRLIGSGGMGEVYRGRDTRLDRTVAIKLLPEEFACNPDRRTRFEREARAVASLSHPHICAMHDIGECPDPRTGAPVLFLVMEHLEGQTLAERLSGGPFPAVDVMRYATELAGALDHAHRCGVVHRDLKPGNVMLTRTGSKLLDFGLSKQHYSPDLRALSTIAPGDGPLTAAGAVLGTYPYMAPEQLSGRETDARSDIFALGAVIFEMATARRAFEGTTAAEVIGAVLHTVPPAVSSLQPSAPPGLDRIVSRCLAKDPEDRWQTSRDLQLELEWTSHHQAGPGREAEAPRRTYLGVVSLALLSIVLLGTAAFVFDRAPQARLDDSAVQLGFAPPAGVTLADSSSGGQVSISPDGRRLAFIAEAPDGTRSLWIRPIDSLDARLLPGTEGASTPFWSPDSGSIAFFAQGRLRRTALGGPVQTLCDAVQPRGGTWSAAGEILFAANAGRQLYRVAAAGGNPVPLALRQPNDESHQPDFLPDGRHFVYYGRRQRPGIYLGSLDSGDTKLLASGYAGAEYAAPGYLILLAGGPKSETAGALMAQRFDTSRLELVGEPVALADQVAVLPFFANGAFSVSENGRLVFGTRHQTTTQLVWFDRQGNQLQVLRPPGKHSQRLDLSPDETAVAIEMVDPQLNSPDIWLMDTVRGATSRFTFEPQAERFPHWSPDGRRVLFSSPRGGRAPALFLKASSGTSDEVLVAESDFNIQPNGWSPDGRLIVYSSLSPDTQRDLWTIPADPALATQDRKATPYLQTPFNESAGQFSPDGRWMSYVSDESGRWEVYVRAFPDSGVKWQISTQGGIEARWRGDGRELFYVTPDGTLMAVAIDTRGRLQAGVPQELFKARFYISGAGAERPSYAATKDGQRFLINAIAAEAEPSSVTVILNWPAAVQR
jgi:serine/threonine protein kinase